MLSTDISLVVPMLPHTIPQVGRTCDIIPQNMKHHNMTRTCYVPQCIVHTAIVTVLCADHRSIGGGGIPTNSRPRTLNDPVGRNVMRRRCCSRGSRHFLYRYHRKPGRVFRRTKKAPRPRVSGSKRHRNRGSWRLLAPAAYHRTYHRTHIDVHSTSVTKSLPIQWNHGMNRRVYYIRQNSASLKQSSQMPSRSTEGVQPKRRTFSC